MNVRYADVMTMADRHTIYKQCLKEVADQMGLSVTFMAKVAADQAGSSCHIHLSLWQGDHSAFTSGQGFGPVRASDTFRWFLGGWLHHLPEMMVFYAPTVNSYKRYQAGSWAPTRIAWSMDNRTAGFRVVGQGPSLRIESRVPGADCNPYLAYAAALFSGLDGIANRIEPPPAFLNAFFFLSPLDSKFGIAQTQSKHLSNARVTTHCSPAPEQCGVDPSPSPFERRLRLPPSAGDKTAVERTRHQSAPDYSSHAHLRGLLPSGALFAHPIQILQTELRDTYMLKQPSVHRGRISSFLWHGGGRSFQGQSVTRLRLFFGRLRSLLEHGSRSVLHLWRRRTNSASTVAATR